MDISFGVEDVAVIVGYCMGAITLATFLLFVFVRVGRRIGIINDENPHGRVSEFLRNFR